LNDAASSSLPSVPRDRTETIGVLDADPELGGSLGGDRLLAARARAVAVRRRLPLERSGTTQMPEASGFGLLVLDGFLLRSVSAGPRTASELLGPGDILQPWVDDRATATVPCAASWRVLQDVTYAALDRGFVGRVAPWPEIAEAVARRLLERSRALSALLLAGRLPGLEARLLMLFAQLADRWGVVRPDGLLVPLKLTHGTLGLLIGAQRPSVTSALSDMARAGTLERTSHGWLVRGDPRASVARCGHGCATERAREPVTDAA
jgi:CRP/FNR family transcriptional regulator, cyclic AMP receptor protein